MARQKKYTLYNCHLLHPNDIFIAFLTICLGTFTRMLKETTEQCQSNSMRPVLSSTKYIHRVPFHWYQSTELKRIKCYLQVCVFVCACLASITTIPYSEAEALQSRISIYFLHPPSIFLIFQNRHVWFRYVGIP